VAALLKRELRRLAGGIEHVRLPVAARTVAATERSAHDEAHKCVVEAKKAPFTHLFRNRAAVEGDDCMGATIKGGIVKDVPLRPV
jgi:hypothetical protein